MFKTLQSRISKRFTLLRPSSSLSSTTTTEFALVYSGSAEIIQLERAMQKRTTFLILLHLLPTDQDERKLRLAWAIMDFKRETDPVTQTAKARKISGMFFHSGSRFEVNNIPSHITRANLVDTCDAIINLQLGEIVRIPGVLAALDAITAGSSKHSLSSSFHTTIVDEEDFAESSGVEQKDEEEPVHHDLALMTRLERMIQNAQSRRRLIQLAVETGISGDVCLKLRFVAVVDQFSRCEDADDKQQMGRKLQAIFLEPHGMFYIPLSQQVQYAVFVQGNFDALETGRVEVLADLCSNAAVLKLLDRV